MDHEPYRRYPAPCFDVLDRLPDEEIDPRGLRPYTPDELAAIERAEQRARDGMRRVMARRSTTHVTTSETTASGAASCAT